MGKFHSYTLELQYLGGFGERFPYKNEWRRTFQVSDSITLEELNDIIQRILDWDATHLYIFRINGRPHSFLGFDFPIILDVPENTYVSCDVKLKTLQLKLNEQFFYEYDFGDLQQFSLRIIKIAEISSSQKASPPKLLSFAGNNIEQYPQIPINSFFEFCKQTPHSSLFDYIIYEDYSKSYKDQIRFIHKDDYATLKKWRKGNDRKRWQKSVVILENLEQSVQSLSEKIERPEKKISKWINTFNAFGLEGIDTKRKKRDESERNKIIQRRTKRILEILHQKPNNFAINRSNWTLKTLVEVYQAEYKEIISKSTIGRYLKNSDYSIKKAKTVLTSPDPDYREKVEDLLNVLGSLAEDEEFFFIDEVGPLRVKKYGGRCYVKKGETLTTPQNQNQKGSITFSAALNAKTNQISWLYEKSKDSSSMINLIEVLFNQHHYRSKLFITWDAASWHSSNELVDWLDAFNAQTNSKGEGPVVEFVPLPKNAQFLNVIEAVFSGMKRAVIHHSNYQTAIAMKTAISLHFLKRNDYFKKNPKRAGNKIWDIDFFKDYNNIKSGNYREW
jgi:transposase